MAVNRRRCDELTLRLLQQGVELVKAMNDSRAEINQLDNTGDEADGGKGFGRLENASFQLGRYHE